MSGRIYRLEGPPGFEPDADFVLGIWSDGAPVIDVTAAFYDEVKGINSLIQSSKTDILPAAVIYSTVKVGGSCATVENTRC